VIHRAAVDFDTPQMRAASCFPRSPEARPLRPGRPSSLAPRSFQLKSFGAERLERLLISCRVVGTDGVLQHIERELKAFRGKREPFDDATMMTVRIG